MMQFMFILNMIIGVGMMTIPTAKLKSQRYVGGRKLTGHLMLSDHYHPLTPTQHHWNSRLGDNYDKEMGKNQVVILPDSKSALQHLARCTSRTRGMPIAYDILKLVYKLRSDGVQLVFQWIPSHVGVGGNEEVDRMAKLAVTDGMCLLDKPYCAELMQLASEKCFAKWQEMFNIESMTKGIWYGTIESKIFIVPWFDNSSLPRDLLVWAFHVRSGSLDKPLHPETWFQCKGRRGAHRDIVIRRRRLDRAIVRGVRGETRVGAAPAAYFAGLSSLGQVF
ncbi:hypothetical protein MSG28_011543 [Choristoneura fumiferana]|uniref:Uncharacterized protein n=1 Tax=Choristoneura fumiferana TaxID=7141 RepID=A0ACC0JNS7_CHOFU|nr:hypothetical protein MSG28_011543 [Choristoneura fumiferana]